MAAMKSSLSPFVAWAVLFIAFSGGCNRNQTTAASDDETTLDVWATESSVSGRMSKLLAAREVPAEVLVTQLPADVAAISDKLTAAAELDPRTFLQLIRDGARKGPPPYDQRLGITQEEYDLLTKGARWELTKRADVVLKIVKTGDDRFTLTGLPDMKELVFEAGLQRVVTPYGDLFRPEPVESGATKGAAGPLNGFVWRSQAFGGELQRFRLPEIVLGQSPTGDAWLKLIVDDTIDDRRIVDYYVRFAGPTK